METIGKTRLIAVTNMKITNVLTTITKLEINYLLKTKVFSAKQSPSTATNHGLSQQFIQIELSGYNAEPNQKDLISRD